MTNCVSVFLLLTNVHKSLKSCMALKIVSTLVDGSYTIFSMADSLSFNCPGDNRPYVFLRNVKISKMVHCIVFVIGFRNGWRYALSMAVTTFLEPIRRPGIRYTAVSGHRDRVFV